MYQFKQGFISLKYTPLKLREATFFKVFSPRVGIFKVKIKLTVVFRFQQRLSCVKLAGSDSVQLITEGGS